jgi:hypothetical protein
MSTQIPKITLNNGVRIPILGFGVYQIPAEQTEQAVTTKRPLPSTRSRPTRSSSAPPTRSSCRSTASSSSPGARSPKARTTSSPTPP